MKFLVKPFAIKNFFEGCIKDCSGDCPSECSGDCFIRF